MTYKLSLPSPPLQSSLLGPRLTAPRFGRVIYFMSDVFNLALTEGRAASGGGAFADFVRRHEAELRRYLHSRLHNTEDVADFMQECFLRLLRYVEVHDEPDLERLMFRIANNLLTDKWRAAHAHHEREHVPLTSVDLVNEAPSQERHVAAEQRLARLKAVIDELPPKCRAVFVFSRIEGLSHADIAEKFGISIKAVEKHITKALAACREKVGDDGV